MFRMEKIRGGSTYGEYLEEHLDYSDYVGEKEKVVGEWFGELQEELGVSGPCAGSKDPGFRALCDGQHPQSGEKLTQYQREDGIRFFDFQCSTSKSVSVLAVTMADERLIEAHKAAVAVGIKELERFAAYRAGKSADSRLPEITGKVIGAMFTHTSARPDHGGGPADPQLHTHCAVANVTKAADGKFYALTEIEMLRAIRYGGKAYENDMARRVSELGYSVRWKHAANGVVESFEIAGVDQSVMDRFSKRSVAVEKAIAEFKAKNGREPSVGELRVLKRETRGEKDPTISTDEMIGRQRAQLSEAEIDALGRAVNEAEKRADENAAKAAVVAPENGLEAAIAHLYERESVVPRHVLLAETLAQNLGRVDLTALKEAVVSDKRLVPLTDAPERLAVKVATADGLKDELRAIQAVRAGTGVLPAYVSESVFKAFGGRDEVELRGRKADVTDQRAVADSVLASTDRYLSLRGVAGAGKTTVLTEIHKGLRVGEWRPLYLAPTASARDVLKAEGYNASTVQQLLAELKNVDLRLPPRTVLVVDEAGLTSNKLGLELMKAAENDGARVIFVGDTKQHTAVEAGDFVRILEEHAPIQQFTLGKIQRQKTEEYRAAMQEAARGNSRAAVERLDQMGWVKEGKGDYLVNAARELVELRAEHGGLNVLGISPTHEEGRAMTSIVRRQLHTRGELGPEKTRVVFDSFDWTAQQRRNLENYVLGHEISISTGKLAGLKANDTGTVIGIHPEKLEIEVRSGEKTFVVPVNAKSVEKFQVGEKREIPFAAGDLLLVTANHKASRLVNGDLLTVKALNEDGSIQTKEGKSIPAEFPHVSHGYVITSHKSQGKTVDHVVVAADTLGSKAAYVALTRGRQTAVLHTAEKENLYRRLPPINTGRLAAADLKKPVEAKIAAAARRTFWKRTVDRANAVARTARAGVNLARRYFYGNRQNAGQRIKQQGTTKVL